tara:strand:+ start:311 stop:1036 length:726 start_codon:yes stop_codon:yes gene_type:complete
MTVPYLAGVIEAKDIKEKGTGFKAKYMAWAKVAQLFNEHCKGWTFHLRPSKEGHLLWEAPLGAYLLCYFKDPSGKEYSDFPYAVMDNRNNAIPVQKITARDISDSARRAFPAACAMQFSLGFELWAQEEIEANEPPQRDPDRWKKLPTSITNTPTQKQQKPIQDITIKNPPLDPQQKDQLMATLASLHQTNSDAFAQFDKAYRSNYSKGDGTIRPEDKISDHIQEPKHAQFVEQWIANYMK